MTFYFSLIPNVRINHFFFSKYSVSLSLSLFLSLHYVNFTLLPFPDFIRSLFRFLFFISFTVIVPATNYFKLFLLFCCVCVCVNLAITTRGWVIILLIFENTKATKVRVLQNVKMRVMKLFSLDQVRLGYFRLAKVRLG